MRKVTSGIICAFLMLLLWASGACASPFHHKEKMSSGPAIASPFHKHGRMSPSLESKKDRQVCLLEHHQKGLPCPHENNQNNNKRPEIRTDCGGKPFGSIPTSVDFSKNLFFALKIPSLTLDDNLGKLFPLSPGYKFYLPLQIDHPPKFI